MLKENAVWETAKQTKLSENPDLGSWYTIGQFFGVRDIYEIWVTGFEGLVAFMLLILTFIIFQHQVFLTV